MQASIERLRQRREGLGDEGGFTLIELLIVIVILGILAAIVVFAVQNLSGSSEKAACQSDYKTVETSVELYKAQVLNYPGGLTATTPTDKDANSVNAAGAAPTTAAPPAFNAGSELLVSDAALPNTGTDATLGPWLKDVPSNSNYTIWVSNDGSGQVTAQASATVAPASAPSSDTFCASL